MALYKAVVTLARAHANLADKMDAAGHTPAEVAQIKTAGQLARCGRA